MNIKRIMLITFLLLAVLTIGAVSASDDVAADNLTVSDDVDVVTDKYDSTDYYIEVYDVIDLENDPDDEPIADITLPLNTKGTFKIINKEEVVASVNVDENDEAEDEVYDCILLKDIDLAKIKVDDELSFKFFENDMEVEKLTQVYKVTSLTTSTMELSKISGSGITDIDLNIQINNIHTEKPDENFTYISVSQKDGFFIISVEGDDEDIIIFCENLKTTNRNYVEINENDTLFYRFGFSFNDINNYIAQKIDYADNFTDLVKKGNIESENEIYFGLYEDDEGYNDIDYETKILILKEGKILFKNEEEDVDVNYNEELEITMNEGWNETELLEFIVRTNITSGKIVIKLNDNETPAFEKNISSLTPTDDSDDEFNHYSILISDLNITQAGEYVIRDYFYDENGECIYQYDDEYPETLKLYEPQSTTVDNITITTNPISTTIRSDETLITINDSSASVDDEVVIYVDGNENPIKIKISECGKDENEYSIKIKQLNLKAFNLEVGEHALNITYKNVNSTAKFNLISNLEIYLPEEDETVYTTFNDAFVFISLEDEGVYYLEGKINLTIMDSEGNITDTIQIDLDEEQSYEDDYLVIRTDNMNKELNGKYTIIVRYFDGNEAATQVKGNVTFKSFDSEEYGTSINGTIKDENDYAITFNDIPPKNIIISIDGKQYAEINETDLNKWLTQANGKYYIKSDKFSGLEEGYHTISITTGTDRIQEPLASGTILIDLKENINPDLTITVSNIEEGNTANVVITTNTTFSGNVTVKVANKNYTVNVDKGHGGISITGLKANTYTATVFLKSDGIFNDSVKSTTFKVNSKTYIPPRKVSVIKLTLKKVKVKKSAKKLVLKATLKIDGKPPKKGTKIIFTFKGKKYTGKTNAKGVAKVTIKKKVLKKLKVGKKVKYTAKYSIKTVKKTVKVKK